MAINTSSPISTLASFFPATWGSLTDQDINQFQFVVDKTPLSSFQTPILTCIFYLTTLWACKTIVRARGKPFDLNWFVIIHNSFLVILSGIAFIALATELLHLISVHGLFTVYCDVHGQLIKGPLIFYYYINYLYKFYELIDTFLLGLRGKPTPFLHVYHHAATLVLCWSQLRAQSCVQWIPIVINLFVHVVMYSYYTLHALGIDVWWKKYLTQLQIVQFIVALVGCFGGFIPFTLHDLGVSWAPKCWGRYPESIFGIFVLLSYLALFIQLYRNIYLKKNAAKKGQTNGHVNGNTKKEL